MFTKSLEKLKQGMVRTKYVLCTLCVLLYLLLAKLSGGSLWDMLLFFLCTAAYLYFPGRFFAWISGMEKQIPNFASPLAILFGTGFLAALYCFCERLGFLWAVRLLPPVLGLIWVLFAARLDVKKVQVHLRTNAAVQCILVLWAGLLVLFALMVTVKNAHPTVAGEILPNQDVLWNIGMRSLFIWLFHHKIFVFHR